MSWILSVMVIPEGINSCNDFPADFTMTPLGSYDEVLKIFKEIFVTVDASDAGWWLVEGKDGHHCEVIVGVERPLIGIGLRKPSLEMIQDLYENTGWRGIDPSDCSIIPPFVEDI